MKPQLYLLFAACCCIVFQTHAQLAGSLDPSFANGGIGKYSVGTPYNNSDESARSVLLQPDGKIILAGRGGDFMMVSRITASGTKDVSFGQNGVTYIKNGTFGFVLTAALQQDGKILIAGYGGNNNNSDFSVVRLNSDGSPDNSFDGDGKLLLPIGSSYDQAYSIVLQPDGKILLAGFSDNNGNEDFSVARLNSDGSLDNSFDGDGKLFLAVGSSQDQAQSIALQPDGKILVAGTSYNGINNDFSVARLNSDGSLDNGFDGDGKLMFAVGSSNDQARSMTVQPDGKILIAGTSNNGSNNDFSVARLNSDGGLDDSFDGDGKLLIVVGSVYDEASSMTLQPDGKILLAGRSNNGSYTDFSVARLNSDGSPDNSFDGDGKMLLPVGSYDDYAASMGLQPDGKILLAGSSDNLTLRDEVSVVRLNSNGTLDNNFDGDGKLMLSFGSSTDEAHAIALQSDGKILLAGYSYNGSNDIDFSVIRLNSDGNLDNSFHGDGKLLLPVGNSYDYARSIALQPDGKILIAGTSYNGSRYVFSIVRLNSDGSLDNSFDGDGKLLLPMANSYDNVTSMILQPDGKILLAGYSDNSNNYDFSIARLNNDGSLDNSFDGDGKLLIAVSSYSDYVWSVALQADGKILLAGKSDVSNTNFLVVRLNSDGSVDSSFDGDGKVFIPVGSSFADVHSIALQPNGKILLAGTANNGSNNNFAVVRLNSDGSIDNSFDGDGKAFILVGSSADALSIALQLDGKILLSGNCYNANNNDFAVVRLDSDGSLDNSFDEDGKAVINAPFYRETVSASALQPDGNLIVAGYGEGDDPGNKFIAMRIQGKNNYTLTCPDKQIFTAVAGQCNVIVNNISANIVPTYTGDINYTLSGATSGNGTGTASGLFFNKGVTTVTYTITDDDNQPLSCSFDVVINPAVEICNGIDDNCDGNVDEGLSTTTYYADADGDGYGDASTLVVNCSQPQGYILNDGDCNDSDPNVYPGAFTDLSPTAVLDPLFDNDGAVTLGHIHGAAFATSALQQDGKLIVYGYTPNLGITRIGLFARYNLDGSLDNSFGDNGVASIDIFSVIGNTISLQSDGKIIVCGEKYISGQHRIVISRYLTNGVIDNSFGVNGSFIMNEAAGARPTSVIIQTDDKIVVGGRWNMKPIVLRLNSNGTLDNSFNNTGVISLNNQNEISSVLLQPDGKIIAVGLIDYQSPLIIRYNSDGTVDNSFNLTQGQFAAGYTITAALQPDGKILLLSQDFDYLYYTVHRINPNGSVDNGFANGAIYSETNINGNSIAIQPDGRILIGGSEGNRILLKRYNSNGSVDNSFADNGSSRIIVECSSGVINSLTISNNKIYGAGRANNISQGVVFAYKLQWEVNCPGDKEVNTDAGQCSAIVNEIDPGVYPLSLVNYTLSGATTGSGSGSASGLEFNSGATTVTYTASDDNSNSCSFIVTVTDDEDPIVQTQDITIYLNENGSASITVYDINGGSYDNCSSFEELSIELNKVDFNCGDVGENTVILMVTDASGNSNTALATVTVIDNTAPSFACPQNRNINLSGNCKLLVPDLISELSGNDNCGNVTFSQNPVAGTLIDAQHNMQYAVTITATDINDNSSTCEVILTAKDMSAPVITSCPANRNVNLNSNCNLLVPDLVSGLSGSDNCGIVTFAQNPVAGTIINAVHNGTYNLAITASDGNGNLATCSVILTAKDIIAPIITSCPGSNTKCFVSNGIYTIPVLTATDNCTIPSISYTISGATSRSGSGNNSSGIFNPGSSTINWIVSDGNGNTSMCSSTVVIDKTDVSISNSYAANINSSIGNPNTIYLGYGGSSITVSSQVTSSVNPNTFTYKWTIGSPGGAAIGTGPTFTASPTTTTVYYLSVKSANNCAPVYQVSKQINVVDIRCGTNKVYVCKYKNGSYTTNCIQATTNNINNLGAGSFLGQCVAQPITAKGAIIEEVKPIETFNANAYPNPSNSSFNIIIQTPNQIERVQLRVINMNGQVIEKKETLLAGEPIKIGERYINGVYMIEVTQGKQKKILKLVKM